MNDFDIANTLLRTSLDRVYGSETEGAKITPGQEALSQLETQSKKDLTEHEWTKIERHLVKTLKEVGGKSASIAEEIDEKANQLFAAVNTYKDKIPPERFELLHKSLLAIHDAAHFKITESLFEECKKNPCAFIKKNPIFQNDDFSREINAFKLRVAYHLAQHDGRLLCDHFKKFPLDDERDRIELAKLVAKTKDYYVLADMIDVFNISDESALQKIFLSIAKKDPDLLESLKKFSIISEKRLVRIFTVLAQKHPSHVAEHIDNFTIWNANDRATIAKRAAEQDGLSVLQELKNFKITDQKEIAAIARKAIIQNPLAIELLPQVELIDVRENMYLLLAAVSLDKNAIHKLPKMNHKEIDEVIDLIKTIEQNGSNAALAKEKLTGICKNDEDLTMVLKRFIEKMT